MDMTSGIMRAPQRAGVPGIFLPALDASLKAMIILAYLNLVTGSVFSEVQVIFCRNALIYYDCPLQNWVLNTLANSLVRGGLLCLDSKETLEFSSVYDQFKPADREERNYLLQNAFKYSRKRETARVEIGFQAQGGRIAYFVSDNGAGFDMFYAEKLFSLFQRMHSAAEFEGTGVGLANVRRVILRHGQSCRRSLAKPCHR